MHQRDDLETFTQTHTMGQNTSRARMLLESLDGFEASIPHELYAFDLVRLQFGDDMFVHRNEFLFGFGVEI
jgi:hypothetical protein